MRDLAWRPRLCEIRWDDGCAGEATDPHEPLLRSRGGAIDDPLNVVLGCHHCHEQVHRFPEMATARGFMIPTGRAVSGNVPEAAGTVLRSLEVRLSGVDPF